MKRLLNFLGLAKQKQHPNALDSDIIESFNKSRSISHKTHLCHAPFNNMYFNSLGEVAMCWLTFQNPPKYSASNSIRDIWFGDEFNKVRENIKVQNLDYKCLTCKKNLERGNFINVLSKAYDNDYPLTDYPSIMEFELSNTCNLECTMCSGLLSSSIRKNRENLPPIENHYGDQFVEELKEFIPYLKEARFNGGEPFMIKIYYQIWDEIFKLNPDVKITVATNGTVLSGKVKDYLSRGNFHLNISMDGFSKEIYEQVRINGNHDRLHENFEWFRNYCAENDRTLCVMINPMRQNWWEMSEFLNWCNEKDVHLWFNSIIHPENQALWSLPSTKLEEIYQQLSLAEIKPNVKTRKGIYNYNVKTYKNLVEQQIITWLNEAKSRETKLNEANTQTEEAPLVKGKDYSKAEFYKALNHWLEQKSELTKEEILAQLKALENAVAGQIDEKTMYKTLGSSPIEIVCEHLQHQKVDDLALKLKEAVLKE